MESANNSTGNSIPEVVQIHSQTFENWIRTVGVNPNHGLKTEQIEALTITFGKNSLPVAKKKSQLLRLIAQFTNPLVLTLLAAAVIAVAIGITSDEDLGFLARYGDAIAIFLIVVLNAFLGFYQEYKAEAALDALQQLSAPTAKVLRNGQLEVLAAKDLVPGDVLELEAGDAIASDARLIQSIQLAAEETALTGESVPVNKDWEAIVLSDASLGDRSNMVFTGTSIVRGKGRAIVTHTGSSTELGRVGALMQSVADQKTPLEQKLDRFGKSILWTCISLSLVLLAWGFWNGGRPWHALLLEAVSLAVAAIPEGLPAITTITLALGMQRMAKRGAIVRKLSAVETLGSATVIASDKTGTLTQNQMTVRAMYVNHQVFSVTGEGYDPQGDFKNSLGGILSELSPTIQSALLASALCNNASIVQDEKTGLWKIVGDPTEGALITLAAKGKIFQNELTDHDRVHEIPFDSERKRMTVLLQKEDGSRIAYLKGSLDALLPLCHRMETDDGSQSLSEEDRGKILHEADAMSLKALRVLALCKRTFVTDHPFPENLADYSDHLEQELSFIGLVAMMDPPRSGVKEAVEICKKAGIRTVMITGDHPLTATAIAKEIGMWNDQDESITGINLAKMSDMELTERIEHIRVFARTTPEQKLRIVRAFKEKGHVVAMTGDGVNDAPALREAHIGVAMGQGGTDVARQAADLVLADDNFATIVDAVREGRAIYKNIQKFIFFLLSSNMGLLVTVFFVSFLGSFFPVWLALTPLMILWINLVTNGLPALGLGVDPPDTTLMQQPPRPTNEGLLRPRDYLGIFIIGTVIGVAALLVYWISPPDSQSMKQARALAFSVLAIAPLFHAWNCRSDLYSIFQIKPFFSKPLFLACVISAGIHFSAVLIPQLQPVFHTFPLAMVEWGILLGLSMIVIPFVEIGKFSFQKYLKSG